MRGVHRLGHVGKTEPHRVKDEAVQARLRRPLRRERLRHSWEAIVGFPFFVYGAVVN